MDKLIQWPRAKYWDKCWNPVIGCRPCSPACEHCYAAAWARRFLQSFEPHPSKDTRPPRRGVVFCGNMTDLFGDWVPIQKQFSFFSALWHFPEPHSGPRPNEATYLFLTKRVERMCDALRNYTQIPHAYFGFTAENQEWYDKRFDTVLNEWPMWANLWLSCEPLLGPVELTPLQQAVYGLGVPRIFKWLVVGCESGPHRRPCKIEWVESIVEQCRAANVPVFVKQICLPNGKFTNKIEEFPEHLRIRQVPWA